MSEQGSTSTSSSAAKVDFLDLCVVGVKIIKNVVVGGELLNRRQCEDLSSKLSETIPNIQELVEYCGASSILFGPVLGNLYRHVEKAKALVSECARKDWYVAAVFQCKNENAFREILLDVGFCYNAIYELAKSKSKEWCSPPEDLRKFYILLEAASDSDVAGDEQDVLKRLDELANGHTIFNFLDYITSWIIPSRVARKQRLAHYLLMRMYWKSKEPKAHTLKSYTAIMWSKALEPAGTWGNLRLLGCGTGASGVCRTTWLGIPCAKKEFHRDDIEIFFTKEAGILAHLKHPCIVDFICCGNGTEKGDRFICMELMEMSLFDLIELQRKKGEPFSLDVALDIMVQMACGVCYLHGEGVAHRDLKPQNVVVKRLSSLEEVDHYCVKLVDFGSSKGGVEACLSNTMTYRGIGTTMYRAPEVHPDANLDGIGKVKWVKADAYSFAMTCAHLLCLEGPFQETRPSKLYDEVMKNGKRPMIPAVYPKDLEQLLKDCWETNPHLRPSFMEICVQLEEIRYKRYTKSYSTTLDEVLENDEHDSSEGFDFIKLKLESSIRPPLNDGEEDGRKHKNYVSLISCMCGSTLQLLKPPQLPSSKETWLCNVCWQVFDGERYCCEACEFDAHTHCVEIKEEVDICFHKHTLHLLVQDYYMDKSNCICDLCGELVQHSKWVYRCEQCNFDVHARCCKLPKKIDHWMLHQHVMIMRQCPHDKRLRCTCCNGEVKEGTWYYACSRKECAGYNVHALCTIFSLFPQCVFDTSHRLTLVPEDGSFYCARCGAFGVSWSYHCNTCDVDIHLDCLDNMDGGKEDKWINTYEAFILENESKDHHMKMNMLLELMYKMPMDKALEGGSSFVSHLPQVIAGMQPSIQRPTSEERLSLGSLANDANLQKQIVAQTTERIKVKKIAAEKGKQKLSTNLIEKLEMLENSLVDLRSSWRNISKDEAQSLTATHNELARRQELVKDQMAMQVQSRMNQAPRIALFCISKKEEAKWVRGILTSLHADMEEVGFVLLCEEPGHEHIIQGTFRKYSEVFGREKAEKLQALVAGGLDVMRRAMSTLQPHQLKSGLRSVTIPCFGANNVWDLRAIEEYGNRSTDECEDAEKVEVLKRAEDSAAKWLRASQESQGWSMLKTHGLQRVQYTITSGEDEVWKHERGKVAWVCKELVESGLKGGTLELLPLKYYNAQDDHQLRLPHVTFED